MTENLEEKKYLAEIEKLNIEIDALKRPFSRPLNWAPMLVAVVAVYSAFNQHQNSELATKASALKLERQEFNAEKNLAQKSKELKEKQNELDNANQQKVAAENSINNLRNEQVRLQATLSDLKIQIDESKIVTAELDARLSTDQADQAAKELVQEVSDGLDVVQASLNETIKQQSERITRLILGMNEDSETIRIFSTNSLINEFQSSSLAIQETLALFDKGAIEELSANGRINALIFLSSTLPEAWDVNLAKIAREKIAFMEARQSQGVRIGSKTRKYISALEKLLDEL